MANLAKFFCGQEVSDVPLAPEATAPLWSTSSAMPAGKYVFNGVGYDCTRKGLYCFSAETPGNIAIRCRLVHWSGPGSTDGDLYSFLSGVSWHHVHATDDEGLTGQTLANAGMTHKWRLRCGPLTDLLLWWLPSYGYTARKIQIWTNEPSNGYNDGHIAFEVMHEGKWKLWDITNGCYFADPVTGIHLSAAEIIALGVLNCARVPIDRDEKRGSSVANGRCLATGQDMSLLSQEGIDEWFSRIYQRWNVA